jgi:CubicO group peptidase (beta-lactamase class C family)
LGFPPGFPEYARADPRRRPSDSDTGPVDRRAGYGYQYQWWTSGTTAYTAIGLQGQRIFVDPATRTVVVKLSYFPPGEQRAEVETDAFLRAASQWRPD